MLGIALLVCGWLVVGLLVPTLVLPGGLRPPLREVFDPSPSPIYPLSPSGTPPSAHDDELHINLVALDDAKQVLSVRVSGHRTCAPTCAAQQLVLVSLRPDEPQQLGLPPFATVSLPANDTLMQTTVDLPVQEHLLQYPFDRVELLLGVALEDVDTDGSVQPIPATDAASHPHLTLQEAISQVQSSVPVSMDPTLVQSPSMPLDYVTVEQLTLTRTDAFKLMTLLLLALISGTALYTVMLRSFHDLMIGFGGLILGVWGVRAMLVPSGLNLRTGVDICIVVVIVVMIGIFSVRAARVIAPYRDRRPESSAGAVDSLAVAANASPADRETCGRASSVETVSDSFAAMGSRVAMLVHTPMRSPRVGRRLVAWNGRIRLSRLRPQAPRGVLNDALARAFDGSRGGCKSCLKLR
jgi:hypothetical protein